MTYSTDNQEVEHCRIHLYENEGVWNTPGVPVDGPDDWSSAPVAIEHLYDLTFNSGHSANDSISSVLTEANCWAELYRDYTYSGSVLRIPPNAVIRRLRDYDMNDTLSSLKLYSYRPAWWSYGAQADTSSYKSYVTDTEPAGSIFRAVNANHAYNQLHTLLGDVLGLIPEVGGILKLYLDLLWPSIGPTGDGVWAEFRDAVDQLVEGIYEQHEIDDLDDALSTIKRNIMALRDNANAYQETQQTGEKDLTLDNVADAYKALLNTLNQYRDKFLPDVAEEASTTVERLRYFSAFGTIYLGTLWMRVHYTDQLFPPEDISQAQIDTWSEELDAEVINLVKAARAAVPELTRARREKVKISGEHHSVENDLYSAYDEGSSWKSPVYEEAIGFVNQYTETLLENPEARAKDCQGRWQDRLEAVVRIAMDEILAPCELWGGFHSSNYGQASTLMFRRVQTGPFGRLGYRGNDPDQGNYSDEYIEDLREGTYYTRLEIHGDNEQVRGFSLRDSAGGTAGLGNTGAPVVDVIEADYPNAISSAFGGEDFRGDNRIALTQLVFRDASGYPLKGYGSSSGSTWQSSGPSGTACRLVGIKGVWYDGRIDGLWLTWEYSIDTYSLPGVDTDA